MIKKYLFLNLLTVLIFSSAMAQQPQKIEISNLSIALNGREVKFVPEMTIHLEGKSLEDIRLYHDNGITVGVLLEMRQQGRRLRLDQRTYVETADGRRRFSARNRLFEDSLVAGNGLFSGRSLEHITYDPVLLKRIFASFNFTLHY